MQEVRGFESRPSCLYIFSQHWLCNGQNKIDCSSPNLRISSTDRCQTDYQPKCIHFVWMFAWLPKKYTKQIFHDNQFYLLSGFMKLAQFYSDDCCIKYYTIMWLWIAFYTGYTEIHRCIHGIICFCLHNSKTIFLIIFWYLNSIKLHFKLASQWHQLR